MLPAKLTFQRSPTLRPLDLSALLMSVPSALSGQMPMTGKPWFTVYVAHSTSRTGMVICTESVWVGYDVAVSMAEYSERRLRPATGDVTLPLVQVQIKEHNARVYTDVMTVHACGRDIVIITWHAFPPPRHTCFPVRAFQVSSSRSALAVWIMLLSVLQSRPRTVEEWPVQRATRAYPRSTL